MRSVTQIPANFAIQSYFDRVLLQTAILPQPPGNPIVDSTRQYAQTPGVGFALHPSSQSPVAIRAKGGDVDTAVITLTPGQKIITGRFTEFEWGLPFGWLGGGNVVLYVIHNEKADVVFPSARMPIIFHRQTIRVQAAVPLAIPNLPLAFPWSNAFSGVQPVNGGPIFAIDPDVTLLVTESSPPGPNSFWASWDQVPAVNPAFATIQYLLSFPTPASSGSIIWLPPELGKLAGDAAVLSFFDDVGMVGIYIDVTRYGRLM